MTSHNLPKIFASRVRARCARRGQPVAQRARELCRGFRHAPPPPATDPNFHPDAVAARAYLAELGAMMAPLRLTHRAYGAAGVRDGLERYTMALLQPAALGAGADAVEDKVRHLLPGTPPGHLPGTPPMHLPCTSRAHLPCTSRGLPLLRHADAPRATSRDLT